MVVGHGMGHGTKCYVPDAKSVWLQAEVIAFDVEAQKLKAKVYAETEDKSTKNYEEREFFLQDKSLQALLKKNNYVEPSLPLQNDDLEETGVEDMITLNHLHEPAILFNVKKRFHAELPYTYTGEICIAVNPYQWLAHLYTEEEHLRYLTIPKEKLPPHVYATSVSSYKHMKSHQTNHSILVSGESGAGKTETTKILMNHLASIAGGMNDATINRIIEVNPLLESFGNAKTVRNDNSSRFGKFTQLQFDGKGKLVGAKCKTYLLEKTRVAHHEDNERNYHIFYQLLDSSDAERQKYQLDRNHAYKYCTLDPSEKIEGRSDAMHFVKTKTALGLIGLNDHDRDVLLTCLSGILNLGELVLASKATNDEESEVTSLTELNRVASLLGLEGKAIQHALCTRTMRARDDVYSVPLKAEDAQHCRDALAKALYHHIFDWLVFQINRSLSHDDMVKTTIGVLDIFGFEHFKVNSFEQFCINYANEKLQQKFTQDVFKTVQIEYEEEGIQWSHIEFLDNQDVLDVIEGKIGIISLLNEELMRPKGNEESFVGKVASLNREDKAHVIEFPKTSRTEFLIKHYAAPVKYEALGFLDKHKDALLPDLSDLIRSSSTKFLQNLFSKGEEENSSSQARRKGSGLTTSTVGTQFKNSLGELMKMIHSTKVHYVRCIKPNAKKSREIVNHEMVVSQLRCAGVIEAIRISRVAYPNRLRHDAFLDKFRLFASSAEGDPQEKCEELMKRMNFKNPDEYQIGRTKIYFQVGVLEIMEDKKNIHLGKLVASLQRIARGFVQRMRYKYTRETIIYIQAWSRRVIQVVRYREMQRRYQCATIIQKHFRGFQKRTEYAQNQRSITKIQSVVRMSLQRAKYLISLQEMKNDADMNNKLQQLQRRLEQEQKRNAEKAQDTVSSPSSSKKVQDVTGVTESIISDAGGMIGKLRQDNAKFKDEIGELRIQLAESRDKYNKLKQQSEVNVSLEAMKIRQLEGELKQQKKKTKEMEKKYATAQKEAEKLKKQVPLPVDGNGSSIGASVNKFGFLNMGKKENVSITSNPDTPSETIQTQLAQKSSDTAKFVKDSVNKIKFRFGGVKAEKDAPRASDAGSSLDGARSSIFNRSSVTGGFSMFSLKGKMNAVKDKYISGDAEQTESVTESFNLDSMPAEELPPGWEARVSRSKGKVYYCNPQLAMTMWERPTPESIKRMKNARNRRQPQPDLPRSSSGGSSERETDIL